MIHNFIPGVEYRRTTDIHDLYGGQRQSGISTPSKSNFIFIFSGESGKQFGYEDGFRPDGLYWYTGQGQVGDMTFTSGNAALQAQQQTKQQILLFDNTAKAHVRFVGEFEFVDYHFEERLDREGNKRQAIIFHLALVDRLPKNTVQEPKASYSLKEQLPANLSLAELRTAALQTGPSNKTKKEIIVTAIIRADAVKRYALGRAAGTCEGCFNPAPFITRKGAFLEVHHLTRLSDGGPDHPENVAALCPNCHRRAHYAKDAKDFNAQVQTHIRKLENSSEHSSSYNV